MQFFFLIQSFAIPFCFQHIQNNSKMPANTGGEKRQCQHPVLNHDSSKSGGFWGIYTLNYTAICYPLCWVKRIKNSYFYFSYSIIKQFAFCKSMHWFFSCNQRLCIFFVSILASLSHAHQPFNLLDTVTVFQDRYFHDLEQRHRLSLTKHLLKPSLFKHPGSKFLAN